MLKVALCGKARAGKDSVSDYLARQYGFVRFAFGDGIRKVCRELFPDQMAQAHKPRALLQGVGQAMRAFNPDVWVNATMRDIVDYRLQQTDMRRIPNIVITDLRQPDEYDRLRSEGFVIIRVIASEDVRRQRMLDAGDTFDERDLMHETEMHTDGFAVDYEIENNGSLAELYAKVDEIMAEVLAE
ncbi:AAA family ATPase [Brevibacillus sp. NSP2.1]|uniref:deoxynucleotide monophosphate kinase family protein n=1 Tax=Brevibacillus sp. NSP2.1 TaxID=3003229 RepID=UPI00047EB902|nr:AAA family ATPase [Brevibacillus sp. NSP2.1]QHZ58616.1 AAA family ATPase [Brevibacillus sp. NSP2.1]